MDASKKNEISLNRNYAFRLLIVVYENDNHQCPITSLVNNVTTSYNMIRRLVDQMEREGLLILIKTYSPHRRFDIKLTGKGIKIAEKLKNIEKEVLIT